jgi:hypothetical protein
VRRGEGQDPYQGLRLQAVGRYGELAVAHGAVELCRSLAAWGGPLVREAVLALGAIGPGASEAMAVVEEVAGSSNHYARLAATEALWKISHDPARVVGPLTSIVEDGWIDPPLADLIIEVGEPMVGVIPVLRGLPPHPRRGLLPQLTRLVASALGSGPSELSVGEILAGWKGRRGTPPASGPSASAPPARQWRSTPCGRRSHRRHAWSDRDRT